MAQHVGLLPSKARTSDASSPIIEIRDKYEAVHVVVDVTAGSGFNITPYIKGRDLTSDQRYVILQGSTINTTGTTVLRVGPDYTAGANIAKDYMPADWYVLVTLSGGVGATYSVGASLI